MSFDRRSGELVTHCIFDFDGTLVNSESFLTKAIHEVVERYGKPFDYDLRLRTVGLHLGLSGPMIVEELNLSLTPQEFSREVLKTFVHNLTVESVEFMPGAKQLVQHLAINGVQLAVCSASSKFTFSLKVKHFDDFFKIGKHFHHIVIAGDDPNAGRNKPFSDPYIYCISLFDPPPNPRQVLVFEDSPTGLQSALGAGCQVVFIPHPKCDKNQFIGEANLIIDSLNDFEPQLFGLPKF